MPHYKVYYFKAEGRAELIRYLLALGGVEFEDIRYDSTEWPQHKDKFPMGQVPVLEEDGHMFSQSLAIARYLARQFNLYGGDTKAQAAVDCVIDTVEDLFRPIFEFYFEKDETRKEELLKKLHDGTLPTYMKMFEKLLSLNLAGEDYFVGASVTLADLAFARLIDMLNKGKFFPDPLKGNPKLDKLYKNVINNPKIAAWIAKRPKTDM